MTDHIRDHDHRDLGLAEIVGWKPPTGMAVPPYGVIRISTFADGIFTTVKPDGEDGLYYVNGPVETPSVGYGSSLLWVRAQPVLFDPAGGVEIGDACGPVDNEWYMSADGTGWRVFVKPNADDIAFVVKDGGGGGGGHVMHYRVDDCDADNYYVTATYWTGGCGDPPGKDEYTELWTVEKLPCDSPWTVDDIDAGSVYGVAAYTYPQTGECTQLWKEISSCGPMTC